MISLYFDKDFIEDFKLRTDYTDSVVWDFYNQFIKKIRGVSVYINDYSIDVLRGKILDEKFYYDISEINTPQILDFKNYFSDPSFFDEGDITKLFFVENCDEDSLEKKTSYYFISNKTLKDKWKLFVSDRDESELSISSRANPSDPRFFSSWSILSEFSHYTRNILLFDLYILENKRNQLIKDNLIPLISKVTEKNHVKATDIIIFAYNLPNTSKKKKELQGLWTIDDLHETFNYLGKCTEKFRQINIVKYEEARNRDGDSEHNRYLITNYFLIRTDAGFNIFKEDASKVNNRDTIRIDSILNNKIRNIIKVTLKNLNAYIGLLEKTDTRALGPDNVISHYLYYPAKSSKFFDITL